MKKWNIDFIIMQGLKIDRILSSINPKGGLKEYERLKTELNYLPNDKYDEVIKEVIRILKI